MDYKNKAIQRRGVDANGAMALLLPAHEDHVVMTLIIIYLRTAVRSDIESNLLD